MDGHISQTSSGHFHWPSTHVCLCLLWSELSEICRTFAKHREESEYNEILPSQRYLVFSVYDYHKYWVLSGIR